jgi:hypothetical protein
LVDEPARRGGVASKELESAANHGGFRAGFKGKERRKCYDPPALRIAPRKRLGLVVERLLGQQEIVIKALDPVVSGAAFAVAGATILGNGRVVLILDVAALFEGRRHGALAGRLAAGVLA